MTGMHPGELVDETLDRISRDVPFYRTLPRELLRDDASGVTRRNLDVLIQALRERKPPGPDAFAHVVESARGRAEEGVPLPDLLAAYVSGIHGLWERAAAEVAPGDTEDLHAITTLLLDILQQSTTAVAEGYLAGFEATSHDKQDVHHSMLAALMERRGAEAAATLGFDLPPTYLVASLSFGTHPDEESPELDTVVATRRKLRRIRTALEYHGRDGTLSSVTATGGLALVPQPGWTDSPKDWQAAAELIRRTQRDVGVDVFAALAVATPAQVGDAVRETGEVLDVVRAFQRPPGTYRLADVLLEYQLTRPSAATDGLAAILAPMDDSPLLLETLRTFLSCGNNRRATATRLHVHPNSVDYRLRRVKELTGLDPTTPEGTQRIAAALAARTLAGHGGVEGAAAAER